MTVTHTHGFYIGQKVVVDCHKRATVLMPLGIGPIQACVRVEMQDGEVCYVNPGRVLTAREWAKPTAIERPPVRKIIG